MAREADDDMNNRFDSQAKSYQQIDDLASSKWKIKKFLPRNEISHDSIQFVVAGEDGTMRTYKKYRNSKMNQSVDLANASSHTILLEQSMQLRDKKNMFADQQSDSNMG